MTVLLSIWRHARGCGATLAVRFDQIKLSSRSFRTFYYDELDKVPFFANVARLRPSESVCGSRGRRLTGGCARAQPLELVQQDRGAHDDGAPEEDLLQRYMHLSCDRGRNSIDRTTESGRGASATRRLRTSRRQRPRGDEAAGCPWCSVGCTLG